MDDYMSGCVTDDLVSYLFLSLKVSLVSEIADVSAGKGNEKQVYHDMTNT